MSAPVVQRVVLLGFMAAGKTTIGRGLAQRLGWAHLDLDREIEREQGRSVADIFDAQGEDFFRRLEAEITPRLLARPRVVLSPGGGWITNPSLLESLPADALTVWLRASPEEVVRRLRADPAAPDRPLLRSGDPETVVRCLLREREPLYRRAAVAIHTDGRSTESVVDQLEEFVRGGRSPRP